MHRETERRGLGASWEETKHRGAGSRPFPLTTVGQPACLSPPWLLNPDLSRAKGGILETDLSDMIFLI